MATSDWAIPTGKAITGATYIKDTDDNISATIEDLVDWCNNANGAYNDYTLTGLRTDFLTKTSTQTITAVTTVDTLGAIDFTGGELRIGGTSVTSTASELNILDGVTSTTSELNILDGVTATAADLNKTSSIIDGVITSGTYTPTGTTGTGTIAVTPNVCTYSRVGNIVTVSGTVYVVFDVAPATVAFYISIPIASNFTTAYGECGGVSSTSRNEGFIISADATNDRAYFLGKVTKSAAGTYMGFSFQYIVQ